MTLAIVFHIEGAPYVVSDCLVSHGNDVLDSPHTAFTPANIKSRHRAILIRKQLFLDEDTILLVAGGAKDIFDFFTSMRDYWRLIKVDERHPEKIREHFDNFFHGRKPIEMMALKMFANQWSFQGFNYAQRNFPNLGDAHAIGSGAEDALKDLDAFYQLHVERLRSADPIEKLDAVRQFVAYKNVKRYFTPESATDKTWGGVLEDSIYDRESKGWHRFGNKLYVTIDVKVINGKISCAPGTILHFYCSDDRNPSVCSVNVGVSSLARQWPILTPDRTVEFLEFADFKPEIVCAQFTFTYENGHRRTAVPSVITAEQLNNNGEEFIFSSDPMVLPFNGRTFRKTSIDCLRFISESPEVFDRLDQADQFRALL